MYEYINEIKICFDVIMSHNRFHTLDDYFSWLSDEHRPVIEALREIFLKIEWVEESTKRDCLYYVYPNGMRVYINTKVQKYPVLGVSRWAKMVKMYPALAGLFDEVKKVVGKVILPDVESVKNKWIDALANLCTEMPKGMWIM